VLVPEKASAARSSASGAVGGGGGGGGVGRPRTTLAGDAVRKINKQFLASKEAILREGKFEPGIPTNQDYERLSRLLQRIKSDSFIPEKVREKAVDLLGTRADVILEIHINELNRYCKELAKGKWAGGLEDAESVIHNRVIDELRQRGCGISEIENEVHKLRLTFTRLIQ